MAGDAAAAAEHGFAVSQRGTLDRALGRPLAVAVTQSIVLQLRQHPTRGVRAQDADRRVVTGPGVAQRQPPLDGGRIGADPIVSVHIQRVVRVGEGQDEFGLPRVRVRARARVPACAHDPVAGEGELQIPGPVGETDLEARVAEAEAAVGVQIEQPVPRILAAARPRRRMVPQRDRLSRGQRAAPVQRPQQVLGAEMQHVARPGRRQYPDPVCGDVRDQWHDHP